ncbi:AraC family transcriptional regulator [Streptomyces sp. NRRL S-87]|uniref:AraC family transcriptional regulator n=1 Tax=Streptomyces sp. NRRL S-87 TaxID=1463920 RepID=UPI0004C23E2A|nr:AraC family transcriptional regulator [Streptomyces sp. NRRL S-87]
MDTLTGLLDGPKARGAFLLKSVFDPGWSLRIEDRAPISVITLVRGTGWVVPDGGDPVPLGPGDVALARGPEPYTLTDTPGLAPHITVGPDQRCHTAEGADVSESMSLGVRTWGSAHPGADAAVLLSGTYLAPGEIGRRLLDALPPLLVRSVDTADRTLVRLLGEEIDKDRPGQELVLDRLLDLLLIGVLRGWLGDPGSGSPSWYRAYGDPVVGPALRLLHQEPAYGWTVAALAARAGVSRAALARRFTEVVGEPPMAYLTGWRLALAADLLRAEPDATLAHVAHRVGYGSPFALSAAFKRIRGTSPQEFRTRTPAAASAAG